MSDEEQLTRTSLADLRSKFEGLVELAEERRARDDHKPRKSTSVPTPSHSGPSSTATSRISRSPSLAPVPRIQIHTSADDMSAISSDPRKDVEAATVSPGGQRVESASRPPPPVPSHSGCNTRSAISPIVLSPSLSIPGNQNPSAIESNNDEGSVEAPPSVASLRSRFDTGIKQNLGTPSALGVKLSPTLRMPSRPVSPDMATASRSNPFDTVARYRASSPLETTPSTSPNRQQLEANEEPVGLSVHTSSPSPVSKPSSKPPPPPIPPKSWNTSSATSEKSTPPSELPIASGSGLSPVPIPPRPITTRMGSATNLLTASPANIPPPLPGRTPTPGTEDTMLPKLPGRAKGAPVTGTTSAHPSHPGLPPRRTSNAAFRSEETLLPTRAQNPPVSTAHTHDTSTDDYQPPPPPQRKTTHNPSPRLQSRVNKSNSQDQNPSDPEDEEDEDGEPQGPKRTMSAFARRALDEYPDSSRAHRRAPDFVPRQYVTGNTQHHVHAFAVCGHTLCLASHHLRVYDLRLGDAYPTFTFDPKSADLEFRGGGAKITAVSFRALSPGTEEGRYVWCGTNEGHLIEVDTSTGKPTCARADVHGTPITHIFRYNEYMLSLEENGKMHIFGPFGESAKSDASRLMSPSGTIRIAEKQNFARMLGSQLWTASGPATRSATDPSLPGPTIRVYEPLGNGTLNNGSGTTHTSEWTGAVTAAAVLSSNPSLVYLAHEGGYVSIFDRDSLDCLSVIKISSSDVLALEGVGDRLWAGYRTGMIQVYDPSTKPWTTTNTWLAHPDYPLMRIHVDKSSVEQTGRFAVWSWARDKVHAWDGLLSADWIETRVEDRADDYSSHSQLNLLICSWNIDSCKPSDLTGVSENTKFLAECIGSADQPDIIIFGFQEVIDLNDRKLAAKTMIFGRKDKHDGRGSANNVSHAYVRWQEKLCSAVGQHTGTAYTMLDTESLVGLMTVVFVRNDFKGRVTDASITTMKRGMGGKYGNKGAIVARCVVDDSSMCFVNVHLAAGQSQRVSRNADLAAILEDKSVLPVAMSPLAFINGGDGTRIGDHETIFISGDLNYRIDQRRENVLAKVEAGDLHYLLEFDQLRKEMKNNSMFRLRTFKEAPIHFAPTYKYTPNSKEYDQSQKKRIPAWCDRVLWKTRTDEYVNCIEYRRYEPLVSDHRPVSARFHVTVKSIDPDGYAEVRKQVADEWFQQEGLLIENIVSRLASTA